MPARREPSLVAPGCFEFLGVPGDLQEIGWDGPQREKLWRYNQHYFDDLNAVRAERRTAWHEALLRDWVRGNPPARGNGWEPYPVSLRIVNWVKWALSGRELPAECIASLAIQARWLRRRLETHLLGNHLFANAKALVFAGLFFEGPEAQNWLRCGLSILDRELREQVLRDGGHFELSTMYHALAVEDMLDLCNLVRAHAAHLAPAQRDSCAGWLSTVRRMLGWMHAMRHPDGELPFFNDAAFGIAPSQAELDAYAARLSVVVPSEGSRWLEASGYLRLEAGPAVALLDLAAVGPDYLPGHAHADTLSMELSVHGQRVLVNSGTSCYGMSPERSRQRGTGAHNTVLVSSEDSSEVWGGFRVARRAKVVQRAVRIGTDLHEAQAVHDGYMRLPGRPLHHRQWTMQRSSLRVADQVSVASMSAEARFHFHPDVAVKAEDGGRQGVLLLPGGQRVRWYVERGEARLETSSWHPRFGTAMPNTRLCVALVRGSSALRFEWDDR